LLEKEEDTDSIAEAEEVEENGNTRMKRCGAGNGVKGGERKKYGTE